MSDVALPHPLRLVNPGPAIDQRAAERAVRALLLALGQDPAAEPVN